MTSTKSTRACLITNPKAGKKGIDLKRVLPVLAEHGWEVEVREKRHGGHATELARKAVSDGFDLIVACGGDGTVGEIVDGMVGTDLALGVLPGGTANLWAHETGVAMDLGTAARQLVGAQRHKVDVGHLTINGEQPQHFLLMAGLGADAAVLSRLNKKWKGRVGMLAYLPAIGRVLPRLKPFAATLDLDGVTSTTDALQIVVANTRRYASVTSVTPTALADDGKLDVCVLAPATPLSALQQISTLVLLKRPSPISATNDRVGSLRVQTPEVVPLQADGGRVKQKNVTVGDDGVTYDFTVKAQSLTVLVPREYDGELFQNGTPTEGVRLPAGSTSGTVKKNRFHVISSGHDSISASRDQDGLVVTIVIAPKTKCRARDGKTCSRRTLLTSLEAGQPIRVKGKLDTERARLIARRIRL